MTRAISDHGSKACTKIRAFRIKEALAAHDYPGRSLAVFADGLDTGRQQAEAQEEQQVILLGSILNTNINELGAQLFSRWGQNLMSAHEDTADQCYDAGQLSTVNNLDGICRVFDHAT